MFSSTRTTSREPGIEGTSAGPADDQGEGELPVLCGPAPPEQIDGDAGGFGQRLLNYRHRRFGVSAAPGTA